MNRALKKHTDTLGALKLTATDRMVIIKSINSYGEESHPAPDDGSLPYFKIDYAVDVLQQALGDGHPTADTLASIQTQTSKGKK